MTLVRKLATIVSKKDIILFVTFYYVSTLIYYTASWISWGGFKPGHPPYFHFEEFSASGGAQFLISFIVTIPIWYITTIVLGKYTLKTRLLSHILFLPLYIAICYFSLLWVTKIFGWSMYWGGYKVIWTLYTFMLFYLVQFGFIHAYTYFKRFKNEEKEKAILRETTLKSQITALKAQLNPHFLHNLFNSINATIPPENERTRELIVQLSDLFRYQNYASQNEYVTVKEEIDFIESYLQLMQIRLKERLHFSFDVPKELYNQKIAPMLLQPLVENAINHGIATKIKPSTLIIKIEKVRDQLHYTIEDTGVGITDKEAVFSKGLGLSNTKMRLQKIYNADLKIEDNIPSGTKISFVI
ncbi:histidine kinase [uncultured Dokdonia sp.]|uniref:sensor histidine kinase n=1 Tax=uncultured Dokdonia sp. TaxID=575653 RepID=UPI0026264E46|nr:histidine kinase [uncultured Dokdonia sp.]